MVDFNKEEEEEIVIDSSNFSQYFFDVRKFGPKEGQVMAKFSAVAIFGEGSEKRDLIKLLLKDKPEAAAMVMRKIHCAREPDCYRICREMLEDLLKGMSEEDVVKKDYEFVLEAFYYTKKEYIPKNNPNWETIDLIKFDSKTNIFKSNIELSNVF
jgi:hypothetical protein